MVANRRSAHLGAPNGLPSSSRRPELPSGRLDAGVQFRTRTETARRCGGHGGGSGRV
jgi:hypothetical protein